jgi:hypothetical protein
MFDGMDDIGFTGESVFLKLRRDPFKPGLMMKFWRIDKQEG